MKVAIVFLLVSVSVLDAAPALRDNDEQDKRGGVMSSHQGFHQSIHRPMFHRSALDKKQWSPEQKKKEVEKRFGDVLGSSWGTSWGDSSWGDPWSGYDDSWGYYGDWYGGGYGYDEWPKKSKRSPNKRSASLDKIGSRDRSRFDRDYIGIITGAYNNFNSGGSQQVPHWADHAAINYNNYYAHQYGSNFYNDHDNYEDCYYYYYYNQYYYYDECMKKKTLETPEKRKAEDSLQERSKNKAVDKKNYYGSYYSPPYGHIPDAPGYDPWGNPLPNGRKAKKNQDKHVAKVAKVAKDAHLHKKGYPPQSYYQNQGYYPSYYYYYPIDPYPYYYYYHGKRSAANFDKDEAKSLLKAKANILKSDKRQKKTLKANPTKKDSQLMQALKRFMEESK